MRHGIQICRVPRVIHGKNRARLRRDALDDPLRIEVQRVGAHIREHDPPPWWSTQFAVAAKLIGEVIASSPGFKPAANAAPCRAAVPELRATAYFAAHPGGKRFFELATLGPVVSQSDRNTSTTAWISSSSIDWRPYGSRVLRTGLPH